MFCFSLSFIVSFRKHHSCLVKEPVTTRRLLAMPRLIHITIIVTEYTTRLHCYKT